MDLRGKANELRKLHFREQPVVFVNAWDAISARIVESLGFPAIATSSAAIAYVEGYPDGHKISRERMLAHVARIAEAVSAPVTADLEGGYGTSVADAMATAHGTINAGAVGLNFEDSVNGKTLLSVRVQCERISAIRDIGKERGVPLVINARTDVYMFDGSDGDLFDETMARARAYIDAGADAIFVPFIDDVDLIERLAGAIPAPMNVLAGADSPDIATLARIGVRRVSLGSMPHAHLLAEFRRNVMEVRDSGTYSFAADRISHADENALVGG